MPNIKHRNPKEIMTLSRLGSFYQSKLSFLRSFIREFKDWEFNKDLFDLDENGYGTAVYSVKTIDRKIPNKTLKFIISCFLFMNQLKITRNIIVVF